MCEMALTLRILGLLPTTIRVQKYAVLTIVAIEHQMHKTDPDMTIFHGTYMFLDLLLQGESSDYEAAEQGCLGVQN